MNAPLAPDPPTLNRHSSATTTDRVIEVTGTADTPGRRLEVLVNSAVVASGAAGIRGEFRIPAVPLNEGLNQIKVRSLYSGVLSVESNTITVTRTVPVVTPPGSHTSGPPAAVTGNRGGFVWDWSNPAHRLIALVAGLVVLVLLLMVILLIKDIAASPYSGSGAVPAGAAAAQQISINVPSGPVPMVWTGLSGTGGIPQGQTLLVFVETPSNPGVFYPQDDAVRNANNTAWSDPEVVIGDSDPCSNAKVYTVVVVPADEQTAAANANFRNSDGDAGYNQEDFASRFGDPIASIDVIRAGTPPGNC